MLETEFIKSLQSNYARIRLAEKPDDRRYQYCILTRGGIKGLLGCSLRYINGQAYLYYDITSKQNTAQLYDKQLIDRKWVLSFFRSLQQVKQELGRFLLDEKNIMVAPEYVFQDVSNRNYFFLYLPYSTEEDGMMQFVDFLIEHIDYEDEQLVECVYGMYEELGKIGVAYLQEKILRDAEKLATVPKENPQFETVQGDAKEWEENIRQDMPEQEKIPDMENASFSKPVKIGLWERLSKKKKKENDRKQSYRENMLEQMEGLAVAEDTSYDATAYEEADYGQTVYMERATEEDKQHKLYTPDGRVAATIESENFLIGKQKDEVNMVLEDETVSRIHARIITEQDLIYLEDLNSTNGTFKNGLRLQPYEKRRIEKNDEIRIGKLLFIFH